MYKKRSPCAQPSGEEYRGRVETLKAGDFTELSLAFHFSLFCRKIQCSDIDKTR